MKNRWASYLKLPRERIHSDHHLSPLSSMPIEKPNAPATERNRDAILDVLRAHLIEGGDLLEIGSGTGQHAIHFARALPQLRWHCSDRAQNLAGIRQWLAEAALPNTPPAIELDVDGAWPERRFDSVFSANTLHIMSWAQVERTFAQLPKIIKPAGQLIIYGPFNYEGRFTSESNAGFDANLKAADPQRGIRDFEAIEQLASDIGLSLQRDISMPANNRCLIWKASA